MHSNNTHSNCNRCFDVQATASMLPTWNGSSPQQRYTTRIPMPMTNEPWIFTHAKNIGGSSQTAQVEPRRNFIRVISISTMNSEPNICGRSVKDPNAIEHKIPADTNADLEFSARIVAIP